VGGNFISSGVSTFNDIAVDPVNNYLVVAYSENGTNLKRISLNALSVNDVKNNDSFSAYPNPTHGTVTIKSGSKIRSAEIISASGQTANAKITDNQVDFSSTSKGFYLLKVTLENGATSVKKIIKE